MSVTITTAAESTKLITNGIVQRQLDLPVGTDDEVFDQLIAAASDFIVGYTNRQFAREQWSELVPGYNSNWLQLGLLPVESINNISVNGTVITDYIIEDPEAGLIFRERGWESSLSYRQNIERYPVSRSSLPRFLVDYWGGFVLPSFSSGDINLPADIQQACIDLVRRWYNDIKSNLNDNVKQIKIGDYVISYDTGGSSDGSQASKLGVSPMILGKLRPWRI